MRCAKSVDVILGERGGDDVDVAERDQRGIRVGAVDDDLQRRALALAQEFGEAGVNDERDRGRRWCRWSASISRCDCATLTISKRLLEVKRAINSRLSCE